jgi:formylglycine-generating enzyme required for sulfatase activity
MIQSLTKTLAVIVSSTILATLTVNATDMRGYLPNTLLATVFNTSHESTGPCPENMVLVTQALVPFCVDMYEATAAEGCHFANPGTSEETALNLANAACKAASQPQVVPWTHVTQIEAQQACSRAGKRLLKPDEWYKAALGTPDPSGAFTEDMCNVARNRADGIAKTGDGMRCVSDSGAYDMVGNVWEWVDGSVAEGKFDGSALPQSGYVTEANLNGMAYTTGSAQDSRYGNDRFWSDPTITAGIMRGGYYDNASHAGIYATYAASPSTFSGDAVGFRCGVTPIVNA